MHGANLAPMWIKSACKSKNSAHNAARIYLLWKFERDWRSEKMKLSQMLLTARGPNQKLDGSLYSTCCNERLVTNT